MDTIHETIKALHASLRDYIEATYHISSVALVKQRQELLEQDGVIHRTPYIESTPKYKKGKRFSEIPGIPESAHALFEELAGSRDESPGILFDPSYHHQVEAIEQNLIGEKNVIITTGTGSGKTESFLLPLLGRLSREAKSNPRTFSGQPAVRALVLYPMNALVNDQLGRLRALVGNRRLVQTFNHWCGRPPRFARYTSRTPYPGVRTPEKDSKRLAAFEKFFIDLIERENSADTDIQNTADELIYTLKVKGKWPAKPDLKNWYGKKGAPWKDKNTGQFIRAVTMPNDSELVTRHEVQANPPDILVTNYSMLEYMLMRPIERGVFDATRAWLKDNPQEKFTIVLDEAHLYRGAAGAEIGLLIRRLRDRLDIPPERLSVICSTASFNDNEYAPEFGGDLSGVPSDSFVSVTGELDLSPDVNKGTIKDANILAKIDPDKLFEGNIDQYNAELREFLAYRGVAPHGGIGRSLFDALSDYGPMNMLINETMEEAKPLHELDEILFEDEVPKEKGEKAVSALLTLGSLARAEPESAGIFPCRVHNFFRGLPGLWVCMDPKCSEISDKDRDGTCGKLYSQPQELCGCGARVLELYTCRNCGTAYGRGHTKNIDNPHALWQDPGEPLRVSGGEISSLYPIDLLLEEPVEEELAELAQYDLLTGQLNPERESDRVRTVYLPQLRLAPDADSFDENKAEFRPCAVCGKSAGNNKSSVQDHQTKGDQPFQALVTRQIQIQRPQVEEATPFNPLRGRKVLTFSDSRQVAARLAPNIQMFSERDSIRPLIVYGYQELQKDSIIRDWISLQDLFFAVLVGARELGVRLRPELQEGESFDANKIVENEFSSDYRPSGNDLLKVLIDVRSQDTPKSILNRILGVIVDRFWGFESLAIATIKEKECHTERLAELPDIPGVAECRESKLSLARFWIRCWIEGDHGFKLPSIPENWSDRGKREGFRYKARPPKRKFEAIKRVINGKQAQEVFWNDWAPRLTNLLTQEMNDGNVVLNGSELTLKLGGEWSQCMTCKSIHRPIYGYSKCVDCQSERVKSLDPDKDSVFLARKGFYRKPVIEALQSDSQPPMALVAAEHTAQLNSPKNEDVFSKAEENELLFQDISLYKNGSRSMDRAIDVLSSTTTMEVGIDLGALSGVALRNMPPSRANYQQRAGRAGRRGSSVATVVAFGSADSHDEHYFTRPDRMIRGDVADPRITLNNLEITRRHVRAFVLQKYHENRLSIEDVDQPHDLFSVLGTVESFKDNKSTLNRDDFNYWIKENEEWLINRVNAWLPGNLQEKDRRIVLDNLIEDCIDEIDSAVFMDSTEVEGLDVDDITAQEEGSLEIPDENGARVQSDKLLDRLLYCGKLPRYAFPTNVTPFVVFDERNSSSNRHELIYAPSQSLPVALSQYAPGKQVWIAGKCYVSGAVYSLNSGEVDKAWKEKRIYMECQECGYAGTFSPDTVARDDVRDCKACGSEESFGPARYWLRPPGFAHPVDVEAVTSPDEIPETSYATRAKLETGEAGYDKDWRDICDHIQGIGFRDHLLVSNTGPKKEGYDYCVACGRIEASRTPGGSLGQKHQKPFPDPENPTCDANISPSRNVFIGGDFITDIVLFKLKVSDPVDLKPTNSATHVALRTVSEALAKAASRILEIEPSELMAEYRPAPTDAGKNGFEAEIYLYDTLPGGAGFSSQLVERGREVFETALTILEECPEGCNSSCYRCLRSFKNKLEHQFLDRHVARQLLKYLLYGQWPDFDGERIRQSSKALFDDLCRTLVDGVDIFYDKMVATSDGVSVRIPILARKGEEEVAVLLAPPLAHEYPANKGLHEWIKESYPIRIVMVDELLVRANLAGATSKVAVEIS